MTDHTPTEQTCTPEACANCWGRHYCSGDADAETARAQQQGWD